jgi:hypothetical protein
MRSTFCLSVCVSPLIPVRMLTRSSSQLHVTPYILVSYEVCEKARMA